MFEAIPLPVTMPMGVENQGELTSYHVEIPYGLQETSTEELEFSHFLQISTDVDEAISKLHAVVRGRLQFIPATGSEAAKLHLQPLPFEQVQLGERLRSPALPNLIIYSNVEPSSVQEAAGLLIQEADLEIGEFENALEQFLNGNSWLTVAAGDFIGRPAIDAALSDRRRIDLAMKDNQDFFINPAHFFFQWPDIDSELEDHPLLQAMESEQHRMLFASKSRKIYVKQGGGNQPPYTSASNAAHSINDALGVAEPGDSIVVLDSATYNEKVIMLNGVTLTSTAILRKPGRVTQNPTGFPTIGDLNTLGPTVSFENLSQPTNISGFIITGGRGDNGSGVRVKHCTKVEIVQNEIHSNSVLPPSGTVDGYQILGGGIAILESRRVTVERNAIRNNGETALHGGGVFIRQSEVKLHDNAIYENKAAAHGGGIAVADSRHVLLSKNTLEENVSGSFGGGIAVMNSHRVTIEKNTIGGSSFDKGNRVTGPALDVTQAIFMANPQGGGGGIGVYGDLEHRAGVRIKDNHIRYNEAHRGGGIEFYAYSHGTLDHNTIEYNETRHPNPTGFLTGGDGGGVAINHIATNRTQFERQEPIELIDNIIEHNQAGDDGGGIYATAGADVALRGSFQKINSNTARNNGGGIRISFGTKLRIISCEVLNNQANLSGGTGAGGGIAVRNAKAQLQLCDVKGNSVNDFGGGGINLTTLDQEGWADLVPGVPTPNEMLTNAYNFDQGAIEILGCTVENNEAQGDRGAGGGLYVVYDKYDVRIHILNSKLTPNPASHTDPVKQKNIVMVDTSYFANPIINDDDDEFTSLDPVMSYDKTLSP